MNGSLYMILQKTKAHDILDISPIKIYKKKKICMEDSRVCHEFYQNHYSHDLLDIFLYSSY